MHDYELSLPVENDLDQHHDTPQQIKVNPFYECREDLHYIFIQDPVWGEASIGERVGDEVFVDLYTNPLVQRLSAIEQLTLPKHFATMPGTTGLTRWEHAWGSVVFARKMIEKVEATGRYIPPNQALIWQLRTFVSDLGHTSFSHLGDWLLQGFGGTEDQHDTELYNTLEVGGVNAILRHHNIVPEEVIFPDVSDWVECPLPDLCIDRVDYGVREISRWLEGYMPGQDWVGRFALDDSLERIVMPNQRVATLFGLEFALLATEHWGHPVHRFQLQLFGELVKSVLVRGNTAAINWYGAQNPLDLFYTIDQDINAATREVGKLNHDLFSIMLDVGRAQRKIFAHSRQSELEQFLSLFRLNVSIAKPDEFPDPLNIHGWAGRYTGVKPVNMELRQVNGMQELEDFKQRDYTLDLFLPPLKPRSIDPLYYDETGKVKRLSETDELFATLVTQQQALQQRAYVARYYADPTFLSQLKARFDGLEGEWQESLQAPRANRKTMEDILRSAGAFAIGSSMVDIRWWG